MIEKKIVDFLPLDLNQTKKFSYKRLEILKVEKVSLVIVLEVFHLLKKETSENPITTVLLLFHDRLPFIF